MITIAILATILVGMGAFTFRELQNAPLGYQDENGFHILWSNNSEEIHDVSCVWVSGAVERDLISQAA